MVNKKPLSTFLFVLLCLVPTHLWCAEVTGVITVNSTHPLANAIVKLEARGETIVTNSNEAGLFLFTNVKATTAVISVTQDGRLLYRAITTLNKKLVIDLSEGMEASLPKDFYTAAMAGLVAGGVLIAETSGRVSRFQDGLFHFLLRVTDDLTGIGAATINGSEFFVIVGGCPGVPLSRMTQFSASGKIVRISSLPTGLGPSGPVCLDGSSKIAYVSSRSSLLITSVNLETGQSKMVADIGTSFQPSGIAAMSLDYKRNVLYLARTVGGIFALDVVKKKTTRIADDSVRADCLAVDPASGRLYYGEGHKISKFDVPNLSSPVEVFAEKGPLKSITAIAVDGTGAVWISDDGPIGLLSFTREGSPRNEFARSTK